MVRQHIDAILPMSHSNTLWHHLCTYICGMNFEGEKHNLFEPTRQRDFSFEAQRWTSIQTLLREHYCFTVYSTGWSDVILNVTYHRNTVSTLFVLLLKFNVVGSRAQGSSSCHVFSQITLSQRQSFFASLWSMFWVLLFFCFVFSNSHFLSFDTVSIAEWKLVQRKTNACEEKRFFLTVAFV